jgi:hypothetical protein
MEPIIKLLRSEDGLQQFEALLALTNLSLLGEETNARILRGNGFAEVENLQLSHVMLIQRAATELVCNLVMSDEVQQEYFKPLSAGVERRVKILGALSQSDDEATSKAASGALAILSADKECLSKIEEVLQYDPFFALADRDDNGELQHRGVEVLKNMILKGRETASAIVNKGGALLLIKVLGTSSSEQAQAGASEALTTLTALNLVLPGTH